MASGRFPIRPLDYTHKNLAVPKELLLDYQNKTLFFTDENNNIFALDSGPVGPTGPTGPTGAVYQMPMVGEISVTTEWLGSEPPYYQIVIVEGITITPDIKVDIQPTADQIAALQAAKVSTLVLENNNGTLILYAFGSKPNTAMTLQCTMQLVH